MLSPLASPLRRPGGVAPSMGVLTECLDSPSSRTVISERMASQSSMSSRSAWSPGPKGVNAETQTEKALTPGRIRSPCSSPYLGTFAAVPDGHTGSLTRHRTSPQSSYRQSRCASEPAESARMGDQNCSPTRAACRVASPPVSAVGLALALTEQQAAFQDPARVKGRTSPGGSCSPGSFAYAPKDRSTSPARSGFGSHALAITDRHSSPSRSSRGRPSRGRSSADPDSRQFAVELQQRLSSACGSLLPDRFVVTSMSPPRMRSPCGSTRSGSRSPQFAQGWGSFRHSPPRMRSPGSSPSHTSFASLGSKRQALSAVFPERLASPQLHGLDRRDLASIRSSNASPVKGGFGPDSLDGSDMGGVGVQLCRFMGGLRQNGSPEGASPYTSRGRSRSPTSAGRSASVPLSPQSSAAASPSLRGGAVFSSEANPVAHIQEGRKHNGRRHFDWNPALTTPFHITDVDIDRNGTSEYLAFNERTEGSGGKPSWYGSDKGFRPPTIDTKDAAGQSRPVDHDNICQGVLSEGLKQLSPGVSQALQLRGDDAGALGDPYKNCSVPSGLQTHDAAGYVAASARWPSTWAVDCTMDKRGVKKVRSCASRRSSSASHSAAGHRDLKDKDGLRPATLRSQIQDGGAYHNDLTFKTNTKFDNFKNSFDGNCAGMGSWERRKDGMFEDSTQAKQGKQSWDSHDDVKHRAIKQRALRNTDKKVYTGLDLSGLQASFPPKLDPLNGYAGKLSNQHGRESQALARKTTKRIVGSGIPPGLTNNARVETAMTTDRFAARDLPGEQRRKSVSSAGRSVRSGRSRARSDSGLRSYGRHRAH